MVFRGTAGAVWCCPRWTARQLRTVLMVLLVLSFFSAQVALQGRRSGLHTSHLRLAVVPRSLSPKDAAALRSRLLEEHRVSRICVVVPSRVFPLPSVFVERLHENIRTSSRITTPQQDSNMAVTVLIVASRHNATALQLLDVPRLASTLGVPVHLIHPSTTKRPTYGEMLNAAFTSPFLSSPSKPRQDTTTGTCDLAFILDPSRLPRSGAFLANLIDEFVEAEVRIATASSAPGPPQVLLSCTTTSKMGTIFDRGFNVSMGQFLGRTLPAATRNLFGFTAKDQRKGRLEPVHLLSPYCLMLRSHLVQRLLSPLPYANVSSVVETASSGQSTILQSLQAIELLHFGQKFMSEEMVRLSVASLKRMPEEARSAVRLTFAAILDAQKLLKRVNGIRWNSRPMAAVGFTEIEAERRKFEGCRDATDGVTLAVAPYQCMTKLLAAQTILVKSLMAQDNGNIPEEFFGWIITLETMRSAMNATSQYAALVSKHEALLLTSGLDEVARRFLTHERDDTTAAANDRFRLVDQTAYSFQPDEVVWKVYNRTLRRLLPYLMPEAPLRVVWDAYCCHCCGFSNEIVHLVYPLQRRYDVRTPLESSCFCPGFPRAVDDSLVRMYMPKENFAIERVSPHEVSVWVAHSQPTAFQNDIFNVRRPDYIVGRTMYEFTKLTDTWLPSLEKDCDEIWVPAAFVARVFERSGVNPNKIVVIPEALDVFFFDPSVHERVSLPPRIVAGNKTHGLYERRHFCNFNASEHEQGGEWAANRSSTSTLPLEKHFKFFSNFKWESRKGWDILFHAYFSTFRKSEPVSLYVLTHIWRNGVTETFVNRHNQSYVEDALIRVARAAGIATLQDAPHFCVFMDDVSEAEIARLYKSSDAFVLPTRGEGWGLPSIQAMSMGLPVISTAWGGQLEFLRKEHSFMIPLDGLEEVPPWSEYTALRGRKWAIPSLRATGELMRVVFANRSLAAAVGARAREFVVQHFSEEVVVELVSQRLEAIREKVLAKRALGGKNENIRGLRLRG